MSTTIRPPSKSARAPGPRGHWLLGSLSAFRKARLAFFDELARDYGDVVSVRLGPRRALIVNHPDLVEEVLVTRNRQFIKHFALRSARVTLGNGLLTSEGEFWRKQRRLAQPAFHRDKIAGHAATMVDLADRESDTWSDGEARDVQEDMMRLKLRIVAKTLFGADVPGEVARASAAMEEALRAFTARVNRLIKLPESLPTPLNRRTRKALTHLDAIVAEFISARRASGGEHSDLLSMLLAARDEDDGTGMTDRQLRDEAMTLFMAGHETTANTLAWAWYLLAEHPEVERALHDELDEFVPDRQPTFDDLPRLPYTERVITETLRLYPTVWIVGREAIEPTEVGGYAVPVGRTVFMSQWVLHRDARFFDDPLSFRPDRWADGLAKRLPRYAYFPFGGGPRICIGNGFAMMESVLLLATIARRWRMRLAPDARIEPLPTMTLRPDHGVDVILSRRRPVPV